MICRDVVHLVGAIATGDLEVGADVREHLESCPPCATAIASAVHARERSERWTSEQRLDRIFNLTIAVALLVIVGGVAALW
jgi:hypothetical protein